MAEPAVKLEAETARRLMKVLRWAEGVMSVPARRPEYPAQADDVTIARITGLATAGLYPAVITRWDSVEGEWFESDFSCKVRTLNDEALIEGNRYVVVPGYEDDDGVNVYFAQSGQGMDCSEPRVIGVCVQTVAGSSGSNCVGPYLFGSGANEGFPDSESAWANPGNVSAEDGNSATASFTLGGIGYTDYLLATDAGHPAFGGVPAGIIVQAKVTATLNGASSGVLALVGTLFFGGSPVGSPVGVSGPFDGGWVTLGAANHTWGWTPAIGDVDSPTFGVGLQGTHTGAMAGDVLAYSIDAIRVSFCSGGSGSAGTSSQVIIVEYEQCDPETGEISRFCRTNPTGCCEDDDDGDDDQEQSFIEEFACTIEQQSTPTPVTLYLNLGNDILHDGSSLSSPGFFGVTSIAMTLDYNGGIGNVMPGLGGGFSYYWYGTAVDDLGRTVYAAMNCTAVFLWAYCEEPATTDVDFFVLNHPYPVGYYLNAAYTSHLSGGAGDVLAWDLGLYLTSRQYYPMTVEAPPCSYPGLTSPDHARIHYCISYTPQTEP